MQANRPLIDRLVAEYAQEARRVYDERVAGDYTFTGIIGLFLYSLKEHYDLVPKGEN